MGTENETPAETPPAQQETPSVPPAQQGPSLAELQAQIQQLNQQLSTVGSTVATLVQPPKPASQEENIPEDPVYRAVAQLQQTTAAQNAELDRLQYLRALDELGEDIGANERQLVEETYKNYRVAGHNVSWMQALQGVVGLARMKELASKAPQRAEARRARRAMNEETLEGSRSTRNTPNLPDPEKMTLNDRLEKYWPEALKDGF